MQKKAHNGHESFQLCCMFKSYVQNDACPLPIHPPRFPSSNWEPGSRVELGPRSPQASQLKCGADFLGWAAVCSAPGSWLVTNILFSLQCLHKSANSLFQALKRQQTNVVYVKMCVVAEVWVPTFWLRLVLTLLALWLILLYKLPRLDVAPIMYWVNSICFQYLF